jgi:DNA topoisomerase-1
MTHQLIIVESPHKARTIQGYLGKDYKVIASKGHVADLGKGGHLGMGIEVDRNFAPRYVIIPDQVDTLEMLMEEAKQAKSILLCSDPDREGEAISWHIQQRLADIGKPMKRITMHEITKKGVAEALKNPRDIDMQLVRSQEARRILDRLVGFMASPFLIRHFGNNLSAGRVQSVLTRLIVDREKEIDEFKPEEYWVIQAVLANEANEQFLAKYDGKVSTKEAATKIKTDLLSAELVVKSVEAAKEKKKAPPPLITAKLQQIMSKGFNISAERTMKAAQSLYERSFITYMRTDSVRANPDAIKEARDWLKENGHAVPKSANNHENKDAAQDAHECIRPTDIALVSNEQFSDDEAAVYEVIRKHFLASQMTPAIYNTLKVVIEAKGTEHALKASGKAIADFGYLAMFGADAGKIDIPNLKAKEKVALVGEDPITTEQKFTQPPPRYSEAHLIETLEKKNIGRPSTFAELLAKIGARNYVERKGNVFHPTDLGKKITNELIKHFSFMNVDYTATMESQLDLIATGKLDHVKMLGEFYQPFKQELNKAYVSHGAEECDLCGSPMLERQGKNGAFLGCQAYPICRNTRPITSKVA